jgi:hypothetical protein
MTKKEEYIKKWKLENKDKVREQNKRYRLTHLEEIKKKNRAYYLEHSDQLVPISRGAEYTRQEKACIYQFMNYDKIAIDDKWPTKESIENILFKSSFPQ